MMKVIPTIFAMMAIADAALAAPAKELFGKSIVVSWNETREQKALNGGSLKHVNRKGELVIYISSAGRAFNRFSYSGGAGKGKAKYGGKSEQVAGGGSDGFENRQVSFQTQSLSIHTPMKGGVRAINISFSAGFSSCTASILTGKGAGSEKIVMKSLGDGHEFEIHSVQTGNTYCSISEGNRMGGSE